MFKAHSSNKLLLLTTSSETLSLSTTLFQHTARVAHILPKTDPVHHTLPKDCPCTPHSSNRQSLYTTLFQQTAPNGPHSSKDCHCTPASSSTLPPCTPSTTYKLTLFHVLLPKAFSIRKYVHIGTVHRHCPLNWGCIKSLP